jgi:hypothetical protein
MKPNYERVYIWHYPLPEGTPRVCTGYYLRPVESILDEPMVPDVSDMVANMVASDPLPPSQDGGSDVPLQPPPKGPTPIGGVAMPLPKVLRA